MNYKIFDKNSKLQLLVIAARQNNSGVKFLISICSKNVKSFIIHNPFRSPAFCDVLEELNIPSVNCHVALIAKSLTRFNALDIYQFIVECMRVLVSPTNGEYIT